MKESLNNILHQDIGNKGVLRLTMDDQNNKNALSEKMITKLADAINRAAETKAINPLIIRVIISSNINCVRCQNMIWVMVYSSFASYSVDFDCEVVFTIFSPTSLINF